MVAALLPAPTVPVILPPSLIRVRVAGPADFLAFFPAWTSADHFPSRPDAAKSGARQNTAVRHKMAVRMHEKYHNSAAPRNRSATRGTITLSAAISGRYYAHQTALHARTWRDDRKRPANADD